LEQKYKTATKIDRLTVTNPNDNWVLSLAATLAIYKVISGKHHELGTS
jgi:hypothetical protein